jgi:hypothetical protein
MSNETISKPLVDWLNDDTTSPMTQLVLLETYRKLEAGLKAAQINEKYWLEQCGIENEKRGISEHNLDIALGDKADYVELLERERDSLKQELATLKAKLNELTEKCANQHQLLRSVFYAADFYKHDNGYRLNKVLHCSDNGKEILVELDERDALKAQLEIEKASELCKECNQHYSPSLIESSTCIFCTVKSLKVQLAGMEKDKEMLDWLLNFITMNGSNGIENMPWSNVTEDQDETDQDRIDLAFDRAAIDAAMNKE